MVFMSSDVVAFYSPRPLWSVGYVREWTWKSDTKLNTKRTKFPLLILFVCLISYSLHCDVQANAQANTLGGLRDIRVHTWDPMEPSDGNLSNESERGVAGARTEVTNAIEDPTGVVSPSVPKPSSPQVKKESAIKLQQKRYPDSPKEAPKNEGIHMENVESAKSTTELESLLASSRNIATDVEKALEESRALRDIGRMAGRVRQEIEKDVNALRTTLEEQSANLDLLQKYQQKENLVLKNQLGYLTPPAMHLQRIEPSLALSSASSQSQSISLPLIGFGLMALLC